MCWGGHPLIESHFSLQVFVFIYHDFIAPCFDKYTSLPEGQLRMAIEKLASSLNFPLRKLLVVEGSKRSAHSNAYFYGFWKNKCIVLFDTLVEDGVLSTKADVGREGEEEEEEVSSGSGKDGAGEKKKGCNTAEVLAILAHELGHWSLSHNLKNIIISEVRDISTWYTYLSEGPGLATHVQGVAWQILLSQVGLKYCCRIPLVS